MRDYDTGMAIASLVCGIVSASLSGLAIPLGIFFPFWGCVTAILGLCTGIIAIVLGSKAKNFYPAGRAIAGFILGIIGSSLHGIIFLCFLVLFFVI